MDSRSYVKNVLVTEARDFTLVKTRLQEDRNIRLLHASAGITSEIAELFELSNKSWNGSDSVLDRVNLMEECSDLLWYIGIACDTLNCIVAVSDSFDYDVEKIKFDDDLNDALFNTASKLSELSGQFADLVIKKTIFYGKPFNAEPLVLLLNKIHMNTECLLLQSGYTVEEARERNIAKLKARYGEKFSEAAALERNLENERKTLETK